MDENKQRQEVSLIGRILSLEILLLIMGLASLAYGILRSDFVQVTIGAIIIIALLLLMRRKKSL